MIDTKLLIEREDGVKIVATRDPALLEKYFQLRHDVKSSAKAMPYRTTGNPKDLASDFILAIAPDERVIGGMRVHIVEPGSDEKLAFEENEIFSTTARMLPGVDFKSLKRTHCGHLSIAEDVRAKGLRSSAIVNDIMKGAIRHMKESGVDLCVTTPKVGNPSYKFTHMVCNAEKQPILDMAIVNNIMSVHNIRDKDPKHFIAIPFKDGLYEQLQNWKEHKAFPLTLHNEDDSGLINYASRLSFPKAVLFDWDEVFADHVTPFARSASHTFAEIHKKYNIDPSEDISVSDSCDPLEHLKKVYAGKPQPILDEAAQIFMQHYQQHWLENTEMVQGAQETFDLLKKMKIPFAIVSNSRTKMLVPQVEKFFGVNADIPVFGDSKKPDTENVQKALDALGVSASRDVWFVGDNMKNDIPAALSMKLFPVLFGPQEAQGINELRRQNLQMSDHGTIGFMQDHKVLQETLLGLEKSWKEAPALTRRAALG